MKAKTRANTPNTGPKIKEIRKATADRPAMFVVTVGGRELGTIEKYNDTRQEKHPWKAFRGVGARVSFAGAFYQEQGGMDAAIRAIVE